MRCPLAVYGNSCVRPRCNRLDHDILASPLPLLLEHKNMANKPLPALPDPSLTTLSVEARHHRAQLIQHFFSDIHEPRIESRRDAWLQVLEEALDDLSVHVSRGDWLSGIKRGRELLKQRPLSIDGTANEGQHDKPLPESPGEPLRKLRLLITRSASPSAEPWGARLVLCLSPSRDRVPPIPTEDDGFDDIPANVGCTFSGNSFTLEQDGFDSTILYGLDVLRGNFLYIQFCCRLIQLIFSRIQC